MQPEIKNISLVEKRWVESSIIKFIIIKNYYFVEERISPSSRERIWFTLILIYYILHWLKLIFFPPASDLRAHNKKMQLQRQKALSGKMRNRDITLTPHVFNYDNHHYQYLKYSKRAKVSSNISISIFLSSSFEEHLKLQNSWNSFLNLKFPTIIL